MKLFELWATLGLDTRDFEQGTKSASGKVQSFGNTIQSSVKASTVAVGNLMSSAVQKVASGFVDMTKQAFGAVATLEQNIGGSEQVFGDYAAEIQNWGKEAFQYVGLSQGEYLGYANRMGSLLQGMGFSQEQSLDLTTDSMQRAADVASIMGVDVASAMEAIAGAAKGNFTMMDNLGVAINDTALANYALETGITKSVSKMSTQEKVALALEMFLNKTAYAAGNYAKENDTLSGSLQTAKASFENLLAGSGTVDDFVRTVENAARVAFKNLKEIVPRLGQSIVSAGKLFAPKVESVLANLWDNELPGFVTRGVNGLINGVNNLLGTNIPTISEIKLPTWSEMKKNVELWWNKIKTKFQEVINFDELGTNISNALANAFSFASDTLGFLNDALKWFQDNRQTATTAIGAIAIAFGILKFTVNPIGAAIDLIKAALILLIANWEDVKAAASALADAVVGAWNSITSAVNAAIAAVEAFLGIPGWTSPEAQADFESKSGGISFEELESNPWIGSPYWPDPNASGLNFVPYDNYLSSLHYGEAVLTRQQAENWRSGGSGGASADEIAAAVSSALEGKAVVLGDQIVGVLTDRIDRSLSKKTKMTRRYAAT